MILKNIIVKSIQWLINERLDYLTFTSLVLLLIHFPPIAEPISDVLPELAIAIIHCVIGGTWLIGFLPKRLLLKITENLAQREQITQNFTPNWQKLFSAYALTH